MKRTLSVFIALVMMLSCFAACFATGAVDLSTPACRCVDHTNAPEGCHCCIYCPNLDLDYVTDCKIDLYGNLDLSRVIYEVKDGIPTVHGYCIEDGKLVECDECTGIYPCNCGHDCCHPCFDHHYFQVGGCTCCVSCPQLNEKNLKITNCVKDENGNLDKSKHGKCYNIVLGGKDDIDCDDCTGVWPCDCEHDCCHPCINHVEELESCGCCVVCPTLNPAYLGSITRCVQDKYGHLDKDKFGTCVDEKGNTVKCDDCTGLWPCDCGHACCNPYDDVEDLPGHNNDPVLSPGQQDDITSYFQYFLRSIKEFFEAFFDVVFELLGIRD